ncbi:hypothetical protein EYF80_054683 [Liparis tanakae]|uniref:Uncharacterized protein n=1 Tax=Liparis tanakae TaxID=230148 RepID=A0A4Z2F272_9TELE|nr:hypothetical protein EYF80_054683 [Liparis tanakae]
MTPQETEREREKGLRGPGDGGSEDPYRGTGLEVSYGGRSGGAGCTGHPGREVCGPALGALRSHLHKGTTGGGGLSGGSEAPPPRLCPLGSAPLGSACSQYLFVMLHLESLQLASLRPLPLTLVLCLVELNRKEEHQKNVMQIGDLALKSLNLPPQILLLLVHALAVAPLFPEVFFKDLHLEHKTTTQEERRCDINRTHSDLGEQLLFLQVVGCVGEVALTRRLLGG